MFESNNEIIFKKELRSVFNDNKDNIVLMCQNIDFRCTPLVAFYHSGEYFLLTDNTDNYKEKTFNKEKDLNTFLVKTIEEESRKILSSLTEDLIKFKNIIFYLKNNKSESDRTKYEIFVDCVNNSTLSKNNNLSEKDIDYLFSDFIKKLMDFDSIVDEVGDIFVLSQNKNVKEIINDIIVDSIIAIE